MSTMWHVPPFCVLACLIAVPLIRRPPVSPRCPLPRRLVYPPRSLVSMGGERLVALLCLVSFSAIAFMRVRCHERRDEMMDEMMSRPLLAFILSFLSPDPLLRVLPCLRASISPSPAGSGDEPVAVDLRLRAWRRFACSFRCRRSLAAARSLFPA